MRANGVWIWYCLSAWSVVDGTTASMGWGRPSPTRCKYILVRSPPASMPPDGRRKPPPTHAQRCPLREVPRMCQVPPSPPQTKGWAYRHEPGRGFSGRLEARMPEASLQGGTCGVPRNPSPVHARHARQCPAFLLRPARHWKPRRPCRLARRNPADSSGNEMPRVQLVSKEPC